MVKADVKHNYYADLELPNTCTIEDVKKQYRRLALCYHPDRNAGKEEEVVPKFQAIQTAHEVLSDPALKAKYDADRRKAGLYPTFSSRPGQQTQQTPSTGTGTPSPYAATSAYPPPPRRTQPGTWQRPQPAGTTPTGADRFTNFTRGAPTARKDPTADRSNNFRAWQNLNTAQERQQQQQQQRAQAQPSPNRPRPPPHADTKMPSEDEIRAGMNYRKAHAAPPPPPPGFDTDRTDARQTAWQAFQQKNAGQPGVGRSNTTRTPKKPGFDPNAPGSDERPAADSGHAYRHRSEDFGRMPPGSFPPPPPGPPPMSPSSPTAQRSFMGDPLRPSKSRGEEQEAQVPYAEGNRKRTPYTGFVGEKTQFAREAADGLRRTASTRDTTKLNSNGGASARARSTSPLERRHKEKKDHEPNRGKKQPFVNYSDSDATDDGPSDSSSADGFESTTTTPAGEPPRSRPGTAPQSKSPFERPKKAPTPPSRHFNGSTNPFSPPPPQSADGAQSDTERPGMGMKQKGSNNMYVDDDSFSAMHDGISMSDRQHAPFESEQWKTRMFGTISSTYNGAGHGKSKKSVPRWAIPSSIEPGTGRVDMKSSEDAIRDASKRQQTTPKKSKKAGKPAMTIDVKCANATPDQQAALAFVRQELEKKHGEVPEGLDMDVFLRLASTAYAGRSCGNTSLDKIVARVFKLFPLVTLYLQTDDSSTCANRNADSFSFPFSNQNDFAHAAAKSRSEEQINTKFTPDGWNGQFTASGDYFAPPPTMGGRKPSSPGRRTRSGLRSGTSHSNTSGSHMPPPSTAANGAPTATNGAAQGTPGEVKFSKEQWENTFKDASWTWPPPPPPNLPASLSGKGGGRVGSGRKASKSGARSAASGTNQQPHVIDEDDTVQVEGADGKVETGAPVGGDEDGDAMDIDSTPPAQHKEQMPEGTPTQGDGVKEPRLYAVPPSTWRQQQTQVNGHDHHRTTSRTSADGNFKANLDDLANVEPLAPHLTNSEGLKNLADMGSTLPFQSQPSVTLPTQPLEPQKLQTPPLPKAPEPPAKLTRQTWHAFTAAFGAYLQAFHAFNNTMLQHFAARERQAQAQMCAGTSWLEAKGDTAGAGAGGGFGSYLQGVKEDEEVREAWGLGCERHVEAVKGFEGMRERVRKLVAQQWGLAEQQACWREDFEAHG